MKYVLASLVAVGLIGGSQVLAEHKREPHTLVDPAIQLESKDERRVTNRAESMSSKHYTNPVTAPANYNEFDREGQQEGEEEAPRRRQF